MNVYFYSDFVKRKNSTKRPAATGILHDCKMKRECALTAPVFLIDGIDLSYNYCQFNGRYYFINDITLNRNNIYEISCIIDVLATYKPDISAYSGYIDRASDAYDPYLYDNNIVAKKAIGTPKTASSPTYTFSTVGSYIFPCMNQYGVEIFCTQNLEDFGPLFMSGTYGLTGFAEWLKSGMANLAAINQYFGKVIWIPFTPTELNAERVAGGSPISVGPISFILDHDTYKIDVDYVHTSLGVADIDKPPMIYNDFRDMSNNWVSYTLYLPGVGDIALDPAVVGNPETAIYPYIYFEPATGEVTYRLRALYNNGAGSANLGTFKGDLSCTIPFGDSQFASQLVGQHLSGGVNGAMSGLSTGNYVGAALSMVGGLVGAGGAALLNAQGVSIYSGQGGFSTSKYNMNFELSAIPLQSADIPNVECGRPLGQIGRIGAHTGFIKMLNANVSIAGFDNEKDMLNEFLNSGFYFE